MKVGHTLNSQELESRNATVFRDSTAHMEGAVLLTVAVVGTIGNLIIFIATTACTRFRNSSSAFLSHHCLLDSIKSVFCVPFACALLLEMDIPFCNALGAGYIFLMTLTAYNLLAIHINEEYQLMDRHGFAYVRGRPDDDQQPLDKKNSFWCVSFGIFMIWFTTILLHLGVAFLPGSAEFSYDIGNCVFNYGTPKNYVIHILWTLLVTAALVIAIVCFAMFLCKLRARMNSEKWTLLHNSMSRDSNHSPRSTSADRHPLDDTLALHTEQEEELHYEFADGAAVDEAAARQMRACLRRVVVMLLMVVSFLLFWYPLFTLIILDVGYKRPPQTYRLCMILAWAHPVTTPLFCGIIYFDVMRSRSTTKSVYSAAIPLRDSTSFSSATFAASDARGKPYHRYKLDHKKYDAGLGFTNTNFSFSNHASPRYVQRSDLEDLTRQGQGGDLHEHSCMTRQRDLEDLTHQGQTGDLHEHSFQDQGPMHLTHQGETGDLREYSSQGQGPMHLTRQGQIGDLHEHSSQGQRPMHLIRQGQTSDLHEHSCMAQGQIQGQGHMQRGGDTDLDCDRYSLNCAQSGETQDYYYCEGLDPVTASERQDVRYQNQCEDNVRLDTTVHTLATNEARRSAYHAHNPSQHVCRSQESYETLM